MAQEITTRDHGAERLLKRLGDLQRSRLGADVGIIGESASSDHGGGGPTVAEIAEMHEFGVGVPQRSFIRDWVTRNQPEIGDLLADLGRQVLSRGKTEREGLAQFGLWAVGQIQEFISSGRITPPLAQNTIDRKGSSIPLIDTGQLRSSITSEVREA